MRLELARVTGAPGRIPLVRGRNRTILDRLLGLPYGLSPWVQHRVRAARFGFYREHYHFCVERAATEAVALGYSSISVIEFGVAGGNGLVELERICEHIEKRLAITIAIFGFDSGTGLPPPTDYRDAPYKWNQGDYRMDRHALERRLSRAKLVLGDVAETVPEFVSTFSPPPLGAVMFDLDYYSSTTHALQVLEASSDHLLPRVYCYFDDLGVIPSLGVPLAIGELNGRLEGARLEQNKRTVFATNPYVAGWQIYEFHNFNHPKYAQPVRGRQEASLANSRRS